MPRIKSSIDVTIAKPGTKRFRQPTAVSVNHGAAPKSAEWRRMVPVGVFMDMAAATCVIRDVATGGTKTINSITWSGWQDILDHPDVGLISTGLTSVMETGSQPYNHETVQHIIQNLCADPRYRTVKVVVAPMSRWGVAVTTGPDNYYWPDSFEPQDDALALPFAEGISNIFNEFPAVVAYNLRDDVTATAPNHKTSALVPFIRQMEAVDTHGRAASGTITDATSGPVLGDLAKLAFHYRYPCGYYSDNVITPEGDFHRSTFAGTPDLGGGGNEYVDMIRLVHQSLPDACVHWWVVQGHQTTVGGAGRLRYPTGRELIMQGWILVGEGARGLFAFCWTDQSGQWEGLGNVNSSDRMSGWSTFAGRVTPDIRSRLLACTRITNAFSVSGGGSSGYRVNYPTAYVSTLYDADSAAYYVVVVNHSTSTASITVTGTGALAGATGTLTNLENGTVTALGGSVSLAGLDGSIWRYSP